MGKCGTCGDMLAKSDLAQDGKGWPQTKRCIRTLKAIGAVVGGRFWRGLKNGCLYLHPRCLEHYDAPNAGKAFAGQMSNKN